MEKILKQDVSGKSGFQMQIWRYWPQESEGRKEKGGIVVRVRADALGALFTGPAENYTGPDFYLEAPPINIGNTRGFESIRGLQVEDTETGRIYKAYFDPERRLFIGSNNSSVNLSFLRGSTLAEEEGASFKMEGLFSQDEIRLYASLVPKFIKKLYDLYFKQLDLTSTVNEDRATRRAGI